MTEIILHTPLWVYAVFAVMLWWGISSRRDRTISLRGVIIPPAIGILATFILGLGGGGWSMIGWISWIVALSLTAGVFFMLNRNRPIIAVLSSGSLKVPGTNQVLLIGMSVFACKYALGYLSATNAGFDTTIDYQILDSVSSGVISGFVVGRSVAFVRLLKREIISAAA